MKKEWHNLSLPEQKPFLHKAEYLLDRGYVIDKTLEQLARQIYEQEG